ncbi:glycosyltransferase [bacterium]|nr:glycosyltransferase [bacterium]
MSVLAVSCLWGSVGVLGVLVSMALFNLLTAPRMHQGKHSAFQPAVSLLIPLRNEAHHVRELIQALKRVEYAPLEILLLDDASTDTTQAVLREEATAQMQVLAGEPLPEEWVGKSWACHQLAQKATGEILIFCDADVRMSASSVQHTVDWLEHTQSGAVTGLPLQVFGSWFEAAVIPFIMHLPIAGLVPLRFLSYSRRPSLVVANGQWFAFTRAAYEASGGHENAEVKNTVLEDMALGRAVVRAGFSVQPLVATHDLKVRMYDSWKALESGFTKNLYLLCGGNRVAVILVMSFSALAYGMPLVLALQEVPWAGLAVGLLLLLRGLVAVLFKTGFQSLLFHPLGAALYGYLLLRSWAAQSFIKTSWKGRPVLAS